MELTSCIFGLSTLMSSYQIYNVKERVSEDQLANLALFTEYGRMAVRDNEEEGGEGREAVAVVVAVAAAAAAATAAAAAVERAPVAGVRSSRTEAVRSSGWSSWCETGLTSTSCPRSS